mgnify:CR=1 FL=1
MLGHASIVTCLVSKSRRLLPSRLRIGVSLHIHGIVEDTTDGEQVTISTAYEEVPRAVDTSTPRACAALGQVPGEHAVPQLGAQCMPDIVGS